MTEIWKIWLTNSKAVWEISNLGRVKRNGQIHKQSVVKGYCRFCGGFVHRAVALMFIENPENKPCVDHIDGDTMNNSVENLRWVTFSENNLNPIWRERQKKVQKEKYENGYVSPCKGRPKTEEHKKKIAEARKGFKESDEQRAKHSAAMKGEGNPMYGKHWKVDKITKTRIYY